MGLSDVFKSAVVTAFTALGDVPKLVVYYKVPATTYNPTTGATTATPTTQTVSIIFGEYDSEQVDNQNILYTDLRIFIPTSSLSCTPTLHDYMIYGADRLNIVSKKIDPADAMWDLQARKP